jgi:hypothetical protein
MTMKKIKNFYKISIMLLLVLAACTEDVRDISFADSIVLPTNVAAVYDITQDNSGAVTITPSADGAIGFNVYFGDGTETPAAISQGESAEHIYAEGTYNVRVEAVSLSGEVVEMTQQLVVSFQAPQNLVVVIENDAAISKQVNITANAEFATIFEVDSGETDVNQPAITGNIGETVSYLYANSGMYSIKVIAKGGAIATTLYEVDFEVTEILAPVQSAPTPAARAEENVSSIFSNAYTDIAGSDFYPNWGQSTLYTAYDLNGDGVLQYSNLNYQGIDIGAEIDASSMEFLHIDIWTPDATSIDIYPLPNGVAPADERFVTKTLVPNEWNSFDIPMSDFTDQGLPTANLKQFKFVGSGSVFIDNLFFYKNPTTFPNVYDDFEGNGTIATWAGDSCGINTSVANPFSDGVNSSATVLEYDDTGGQYANIFFDVTPNFDLSVKTSFSVKVYVASTDVTGTSPNQVSLKLQDGTVGEPWGTQSEIIKPIALDTWQTLTFDFANDVVLGAANPIARTDFNRVLFQVNGENNNDNVKAYFDDFAWGDDLFTGPIPQDDFEGGGNISTWFGDACGLNASLANPYLDAMNSSDTVLEYDDTGGQYANIRFDTETNFNMEKHTFSLKVYVASADVSGTAPNQISLKLQDGTAGEPWAQQTEIVKPIVLDTWQTLTFDFMNDEIGGAADPLDRTDFNRVVIQFNGENNNDPVKAFIDDFKYQ